MGGGGGGVVLWYFHTYVGGGNFFGFKILKFSFFGFSEKYFLGMKILWIFLGDHHKIRLYLGVISMHFGVFFKVNVQNGVFFGGGGWGCYNFKYFGGVLEIPVFFCLFVCLFFWGVYGRCWARAYVWRKNESTPPTPWDYRMKTTKSCRFVGGRDATVALPAWIGLAPYRIVEASWVFVSIPSSTVVNRSAAVMSRSGSVDESCRHRRSIVRHRSDAGISFFSIPTRPDATRFYHLSQIGMSRAESGLESWQCNWGFIYFPNLVLVLYSTSPLTKVDMF